MNGEISGKRKRDAYLNRMDFVWVCNVDPHCRYRQR